MRVSFCARQFGQVLLVARPPAFKHTGELKQRAFRIELVLHSWRARLVVAVVWVEIFCAVNKTTMAYENRGIFWKNCTAAKSSKPEALVRALHHSVAYHDAPVSSIGNFERKNP
jgi:hypothetical protein